MAGNNGTFGSNDLVTVMAGMNDIITLYTSNQPSPTANSSALIEAARQAGNEVGAQVVRITDRSAKVIVSTIPDMGLSPFAVKEEAANPGEGRAALLSKMSTEFNTRLRLKLQDVRDGGRAVGLILADELVLSMTNNPSLYGISNVTQGSCGTTTVDQLLQCDQTTTQDSVAGQSYGAAWLWADDTHLGPNVQSRLGSAAETRARNNPF
jgi:phospholipase/lecithinase/hemolysin